MSNRRYLASAAIMAVALSGCGNDEGYRLPVHPTSGTVTQGGQPFKRAIVRFHPVDPKIVELPSGETGPPLVLTTETDENGHYVMSSYLQGDGIPAGDYKITVRPVSSIPTQHVDVESSGGDLEDDTRAAGKSIPKADPPGPYASPTTTTLKATIKDGENVVDLPLD